MAGQIGEYISNVTIEEWTELETLVNWFGNNSGFNEGTVYSVFNNSSTSFKFIYTDDLDTSAFGTYVNQGSNIYFKPAGNEKLYIKGFNFNISISEVK